MPKQSRRQFLANAAVMTALGGLAPLFPQVRSAYAATPTRLAVERRTLEVLGRSASVFGILQPDGAHGMTLDPGARFAVELANRCGEETSVHWHGMTPPFAQDGVADHERPALQPGTRQAYDFAARPGTHWMHSHHGLQEQLLLAAPLVVRTADDLRADMQDVTVLLHDFTFKSPAEVLAGLTGASEMGHDGRSGAGHPGGGHAGHAAAPGHGHGNHAANGAMDLNDVEYDAYLANDRTLEDPLVVQAERGGQVRIRLINGATSTAFHIDLGNLDGTVVAVDGNPVGPVSGRRFGMTMGQRLDILLRLPAEGGAFPILAQREGDRQRTGIILATPGAAVAKVPGLADRLAGAVDLSLEADLSAIEPLPSRPVDAVHRIALTGSMTPYIWSIDDRTWGRHRPLTVRQGQRVRVEMANHTDMAHPMHLHGHHFQVVALGGKPVAGAVRDTVLVPPHGSVSVVFDADNPGRWPLHCHNLMHMATGMMTEIVYA